MEVFGSTFEYWHCSALVDEVCRQTCEDRVEGAFAGRRGCHTLDIQCLDVG